MKSIIRYLPMAFFVMTMGTACKKYIDVTNPDTLVDPTFWKTENSVRTYAWEFYNSFPGFGNNSNTNGDFYFPTLSDDQASPSLAQFPSNPPVTNADWTVNTTYLVGSTWTYAFVSFGYVRKANIMLERVDLVPMADEAKNHWKGVACFFRALQYFKMVQEFGGVPWYGHSTTISDSGQIYKPRDPRQLVMDSVLADLNYAVANLRQADQPNTINKDVALALKARVCLYEGTYRKYHTELGLPDADKYLTEAKNAAQTLISSPSYALDKSYQTAYNSENLSGDKEIILYKRYEATFLQHSLISYLYSSTAMNGPTKSAVESYLCKDGLPIGLSPLYKGDATVSDVMANRDSRLGITIDSSYYYYIGHVKNSLSSSTGYRPIKYLPDTSRLKSIPTSINTSTTDAPLFWLAEVYLNYAEAAAELGTITQADLDNTINKLRDRANVAHLTLDPGFTDPRKDADVSSLIWEIRRERRAELMMDGFRFQDLMRWKKGYYMDYTANPDAYLGAKVPSNGTVKLNPNGYITPYKLPVTRTFADRNYLSPIPTSQLALYPKDIADHMQNPGW
ncbi:RagB/SusD family nutrient uptake outer membrane protein [Flavitalea sp. BT771]|uniref:RagB/SusD family nutrient uptake outer membrane protein n=1 Tax=Flavitalea sp. BT771 TaxID=3063329 RepID=UPI0026E27128|nr:RagB/SusD family nutrient uptake outer membrane protein [Flavitalea sp. BT771]MDO6430094.1 RagB/SusD family nutrient uptake outer membrane protein [Flavitalea sp. BT771]MDV6219767.1 RagB/SusD family nutrient uptake outer membrane protein [Flavitalea sp. BT771]